MTSKTIRPGLYVVATPIGNLGDMSNRALQVLDAADAVACEDTRVSGKLLKHYGISAQTMRYDDHNAAKMRPRILERLMAGDSIALISDAGTPLISDPGYKLVSACHDRDIPVYSIPGPSSVMAALSIAGVPTDRFVFLGFLSNKAPARRKMLEAYKALQASLVIMESPKRLGAMLSDAAEVLGRERTAAVARELTKLHEEVRRAPLGELAEAYAGGRETKGEVVVVLGPPEESPEPSPALIDNAIREALAHGESVKTIAETLSETHGWAKRRIYNRAVVLKDAGDEPDDKGGP